jgi:hypothetical protein
MRLTIGHISKIFLLLLIIQNIINGIVFKKPPMYYLSYGGVFVIFILALLILERWFTDKKIHSILFLLSGFMGQLLTTQGNFAPAVFFMMAIYCFNHKTFTFISLILMLLSLFIKSIINHFGTNDIINLLLIESLMMFYYYKLWHPKKINIKSDLQLDLDDEEIIAGMIAGKSIKEMSDEMNLAETTIRDRQRKMRNKMEVKTNIQLIYNLSIRGDIENVI